MSPSPLYKRTSTDSSSHSLEAIQSYPDLFDGVSVGAPGFDFVGQIAWIGYVFKSLGTNSSDTWLTDTDWQMVHEMVLDQCDNLDGATDGIVEDTRRCHADPSDWLCDNTTDSDWCLESTQVEAVQKIFTPFVVNGTIIHSGAAHGDEARLIQAIYGGLPISWLTEWMSYIVKEDLSWNSARWTEADALESLRQNPFNVQTFDGDISAFRDRGGKVLHWHGQGESMTP
jgi:feruloyl esterase